MEAASFSDGALYSFTNGNTIVTIDVQTGGFTTVGGAYNLPSLQSVLSAVPHFHSVFDYWDE